MSRKKKRIRHLNKTYFEQNVERLQEKFGRDPTDEELCTIVSYGYPFHTVAWRLMIRRKCSPDHFQRISKCSSLYQGKAYAHIIANYRHIDDLFFVAVRDTPFARKAVGKIAAMQLSAADLENILRVVPLNQHIYLFAAIILKQGHNMKTLLEVVPTIYERYGVQLHAKGVRYHRMDKQSLQRALRGKGCARVAQLLIREQPTRENYLMIFEALKTEKTAVFLEALEKLCVTDIGINWRKACAFLPAELPIPMEVNACVEFLLKLNNYASGLRVLLKHSKIFKNYAAAALLEIKPVALLDIRLILQYGTFRQCQKAACILASRKGARLKLLVLAWQRAKKVRLQIEQKILNVCRKNSRAYLKHLSPHLYARLERFYPSQFKT